MVSERACVSACEVGGAHCAWGRLVGRVGLGSGHVGAPTWLPPPPPARAGARGAGGVIPPNGALPLRPCKLHAHARMVCGCAHFIPPRPTPSRTHTHTHARSHPRIRCGAAGHQLSAAAQASTVREEAPAWAHWLSCLRTGRGEGGRAHAARVLPPPHPPCPPSLPARTRSLAAHQTSAAAPPCLFHQPTHPLICRCPCVLTAGA